MNYLLMNELVLVDLPDSRTSSILPDWVKGENLNQDERFFKMMYQNARKKRKE